MIKDWKALVGKKRRRISRAPSSEGAHSEEEVLVPTSSLRLDADGALSDQALSLSKQLQSALPHDGEDGDDSLSRKVATEALLFEEQVRDECGNEEFCLVFVGMNGSGKSTSINMIVQVLAPCHRQMDARSQFCPADTSFGQCDLVRMVSSSQN